MFTPSTKHPAPIAVGVLSIVVNITTPPALIVAWGWGVRLVTEIAESTVAELAGSSAPWDPTWPWAATQKNRMREALH